MGEVTTLTKAATNTTSLRTTVHASIVKQFNLSDGDKLDWSLTVKDGNIIYSCSNVEVRIALPRAIGRLIQWRDKKNQTGFLVSELVMITSSTRLIAFFSNL